MTARPESSTLPGTPDQGAGSVRRGFASDNAAGVHPEVLAAIAEANTGHAAAYGADAISEALRSWARREFGEPALILPVPNGTGANVLALQAVSPRWGGVVCAAQAHVATDENAALPRVAGVALLPQPSPDAKLRPDDVRRAVRNHHAVHGVTPTTVSVTQTTELGTRYSLDELRDVVTAAHDEGLRVHLDGARLANAAAGLEIGLGEFVRESGVDVLSLGATKTGAMAAEAVVVRDPEAVEGRADARTALENLRKIDLQLISKQRFIAAQLLAMFDGDLWRRTASHANGMAQRLAHGLRQAPGVEIALPVEANGVFPVLPAALAARLHERFDFYDWDDRGTVRLLCSWDTSEADVDAFVAEATRSA